MDEYRKGYQAGYAAGKRAIKPLSDVSKLKPIVKTANWVGIDDSPHDDWECNACGFVFFGDNRVPRWAHYCPNCGSEMREE